MSVAHGRSARSRRQPSRYEDEDEYERVPRARDPTTVPKRRKSQPAPCDAQADASPADPVDADVAEPSRRPARAAARLQAIPVDQQAVSRMNQLIRKYDDAAKTKQQEVNCGLSEAELQSLATKLVRYMYFKNFEKRGAPVTRQDLVAQVKATYAEHKNIRKIPAVAIAIAQVKSIQLCGIEMRELERLGGEAKKKQTVDDDKQGAKEYVLRSVLPSELLTAVVHDKREDAERALLMVILAIIHLNGGKVAEDELQRHLIQLALRPDNNHPVFNNPSDMLKKFEQQRYLHRAGGREPVITWGENATDEFSKKDVEAFVEREFADVEQRGGLPGDEADTDSRDSDVVIVSD